MESPQDRITTSISTVELERRWKAAREIMREQNLDYLIMRNVEEFLGGYVKWFTDIPARHNYPFTVIFPVDDEMTIISSGPMAPAEPGPPEWAVRGVKTRLCAPYFPSVYYTGTYDADLTVTVLKGKKGITIGLVGRSHFPIDFYEHLIQHLPGATFVDATDQLDQIKAIKSPEELELIKKTAWMQDQALEYVKNRIKPGMRGFEVYSEVLYFTSLHGSERGLILVGSGPSGKPTPFAPRHFQNRVIKEGDQISLLIEVNGPGGYYTELGRIFTLGPPSQELQDAFGAAVEAQQLELELIKPGVDPRIIWDANNAYLVKRGYFPEGRLHAHGMGYDLVERPLIRYDESMELAANMNITVHPTATNERIWAGVVDNYIVTETGVSECLHRSPKEIIAL